MSGSDEKQRLAAILVADVAGYSRLMAADENQTVASLETARAIFVSDIEARKRRDDFSGVSFSACVH